MTLLYMAVRALIAFILCAATSSIWIGNETGMIFHIVIFIVGYICLEIYLYFKRYKDDNY